MNTNEQGIAIDGFDVVAYFTEDRAVRGSAELVVNHGGAKFYFANRENRELFRKSPEQYVPRFEGFCAFGIAAHKMRVPADPRTFKIYNGDLLLFFNDLHEGTPVNTKLMWNANEKKLHADASATWQSIA